MSTSHSMQQRTLLALEFDKILERLARFCLTEAGRRATLALLPHVCKETLLQAQALFVQYQSWKQRSDFVLSSFPDLEPVLALLQRPTPFFDTDALWLLKEALVQVKKAVLSIQALEKEAGAYAELFACATAHPLPEKSIAALNRCLSDDGLLRDESSPELMLVRSELRRLHQGCLRQVKEFATRYNIGHFLQDEYMTLASDRYVLPLKSNFKGRLQGVIHDYSQTGETCYFEPMFLVEQNNRLQELKREEREEERRVMEYLSSLLVDEGPFVEKAWTFLVELDVLLAKHKLAQSYNGHCLDIEEQAPLCLLQARHPLLALDMGDKALPLDIELRSGERALIISGGNAGGKTVCLKTLGLINAMTLAALPCPASPASSLPWWPLTFAFIGDEQSLDDHVSTFTAQIHHLNATMEKADGHTLVLLDEFGVGTDPAQGAALAQAVLDELIERGSHVIAATHFPALKLYALTRENVRAASVLFDERTKKPLFSLAYDQVGASQALDVAREHGLLPSIIQKAEHYLLIEGQDSAQLIDKLNQLAVTREEELRLLKKEQELFKAKKERLTERFEAEKERLEREVHKGIQEIMREWKTSRANHKQSMKALQTLRKELNRQEQTEPSPSQALNLQELAAGQWVHYQPWNKKALILELDSKGSKAKLDMSGVSLWANLSQMAPLTSQPVTQALRQGHTVRANSDEGSMQKLDLRGQRADAAEEALFKFLDTALLRGLDSVEIIHGRGTGVLRKQVHALLKNFAGVDHFNLGNEEQGGDGMTIVFLK